MWFRAPNINVLNWSSLSPDLNPIEYMWGLLVKNISVQRVVFEDRQQLLTAITEAWQSLPADYHRNLCLSMLRKLVRGIELNRSMTKYLFFLLFFYFDLFQDFFN